MAINYNNMQRGYAFAASFQAAYLEAIRPHQNLRFYQVRRLNDNTAFMLVNGIGAGKKISAKSILPARVKRRLSRCSTRYH